MRTVLLDADGTIDDWVGVIIAAPTGISYQCQCGGTACFQRSVEGYYVPVVGVAVVGETSIRRAPGIHELRDFFLKRIGVESPSEGPTAWGDPSALAELHGMVHAIPWWTHGGSPTRTNRVALSIDEARLQEIVEGWVPVDLGEDGVGVLVWGNSD